MTERLVSAAITRADVVHSRGIRSHAQLRLALNPDTFNSTVGEFGDIDGFLTSTGRFVDRDEAKEVAIAAGQVHASWKTAQRALLSSDINW
jgi:hypothetical protein